MNDCAFCKIIQKELQANIIFEDNKILVILDSDEVIKGHILIIWKKHFLNASDLSENDFIYFSKILYRAEKAVLKIVNKKRAIVLKSGGIISHFHFHIYPVDLKMGWNEIKQIFAKQIKYNYKQDEKEKLIKELKLELL